VSILGRRADVAMAPNFTPKIVPPFTLHFLRDSQVPSPLVPFQRHPSLKGIVNFPLGPCDSLTTLWLYLVILSYGGYGG
jgi:hypothetical protein